MNIIENSKSNFIIQKDEDLKNLHQLINQQDKDKLIFFINKLNPEYLFELLNDNSKHENECTLLHFAASKNKVDILEPLIDRIFIYLSSNEINIKDIVNYDDENILNIFTPSIEMAKYLSTIGFNNEDFYFNELYRCIITSNDYRAIKTLSLLFEKKLLLLTFNTLSSRDKNSIFHIAASKGKTHILGLLIIYLLEIKINIKTFINKDKESIADVAYISFENSMLNLLFKIYTLEELEKTSIVYDAFKHEDWELCKDIIFKGFSGDKIINGLENSSFFFIALNSNCNLENKFNFFESLINNGANINSLNLKGHSLSSLLIEEILSINNSIDYNNINKSNNKSRLNEMHNLLYTLNFFLNKKININEDSKELINNNSRIFKSFNSSIEILINKNTQNQNFSLNL